MSSLSDRSSCLFSPGRQIISVYGRRLRNLSVLLVTLAALSPGLLMAAERSARRPNIVLILADDLGFSDLGCYGGEIRTPNLDKLAADGLRFTRFYNCSRCCPSRACLLSGLYPQQVGVGLMTGDDGPRFPGYRGRLSDHCRTIAEVLHAAGYSTLMSGKWHVGDVSPIQRGFDEFYGFTHQHSVNCWKEKDFVRLPANRPRRVYPRGAFYSTDAITDYALDFIAAARAKRDRPWFLYLAYNAPHFPLQAPREDIARYSKLYEQGWDKVRAGRFEWLQRLKLLPEGTTLSPRSTIPPNWAANKKGWANKANPAWDGLPAERRADLARRMAIYAAMVDRLDQNVGRVLADLRKHGELDNTFILFLSDNGACAEWDPFGFDGSSGPNNVLHHGAALDRMGDEDSYLSYGSGWANTCNTPFRLYKHYEHEGGISTPLIVHWPARIKARGELRGQPGHLIDLLPTCAAAAGATYPADKFPPLEGKSLLPAFDNRPLDREFLAWEHEGNRALRLGNWKIVALKGRPWSLYDVTADRTEQNDLAAKYPERVKELTALWDKWARRVHVYPSPILGKAP